MDRKNDNLPSPYSTGDIDLNNLQDCHHDINHHDNVNHVINDHVVNDHDHEKSCPNSNTNSIVCNHAARQFSRQSNRSRGSCHSHRGLFLAAQRSLDEPDSEVGSLFFLSLGIFGPTYRPFVLSSVRMIVIIFSR